MTEIQDIMIYESGDGGEFSIRNNDLETNQSIINSVYLALFGGNVEQSTSTNIEAGTVRQDWWGNELTTQSVFNSEFERTLTSVALNSAGVKLLEEAAKNDLKFLSVFCNVTVNIDVIDVDKIKIEISIIEPDSRENIVKFVFDRLRNELIQEATI